VGYFRLAMMLINLVMMPVDPLIAPTYTEITQTIAHRQWKETLSLLRRVTGIAALWTGFAGGGLALLGWLFIPLLYKPASLPAYPAVLLLLIGYGFANIFNWNRSFLLALGKPEYPLLVSVQVGILELSLMFWLTPLYGYLACAAILSGYFVISISLTIWLGLRQLRLQRLRDLSSTATGREDVLLEP
jgi:O-antigen/teichoic acid export membrane protein